MIMMNADNEDAKKEQVRDNQHDNVNGYNNNNVNVYINQFKITLNIKK